MKNKIVHLVSTKYVTQRRLKEVEQREATAAAESAALEKIPDKAKEKVPPPPKQQQKLTKVPRSCEAAHEDSKVEAQRGERFIT